LIVFQASHNVRALRLPIALECSWGSSGAWYRAGRGQKEESTMACCPKSAKKKVAKKKKAKKTTKKTKK
jgi:hypothetical protein